MPESYSKKRKKKRKRKRKYNNKQRAETINKNLPKEKAISNRKRDLGEAPMSMSCLKSSGLLMEAMHPIIPDMECPTKIKD